MPPRIQLALPRLPNGEPHLTHATWLHYLRVWLNGIGFTEPVRTRQVRTFIELGLITAQSLPNGYIIQYYMLQREEVLATFYFVA
jgi:hypothetical protein